MLVFTCYGGKILNNNNKKAIEKLFICEVTDFTTDTKNNKIEDTHD